MPMKIIYMYLISSIMIFANINTIVSVLPLQTFVESIGGDRVDVTVMVSPGSSPHTYEPKPSQMKDISKADMYFAIDVEFENVWLGKFKDLNPKMQIVDLSKGVEKMYIQEHSHNHKESKRRDGKDPHIWLSPKNVQIIAENIYKALSKIDPDNESFYRSNYSKFKTKIEQTDSKIKDILSSLPKGTKFMVLHPAWGYFAHEYGLKQVSIEIEGKSPKAKEMLFLIKEAKEENIQAIFTQAEFSDATAKIMADELNIPVIKVSPLSLKWSENLIAISKSIAGK